MLNESYCTCDENKQPKNPLSHGGENAGFTLWLVYINHIQHKIQMCILSNLQITAD